MRISCIFVKTPHSFLFHDCFKIYDSVACKRIIKDKYMCYVHVYNLIKSERDTLNPEALYYIKDRLSRQEQRIAYFERNKIRWLIPTDNMLSAIFQEKFNTVNTYMHLSITWKVICTYYYTFPKIYLSNWQIVQNFFWGGVSIPALKFTFLQTLYDWLKASNLVYPNSLSDMLDTCSFEV